MATKNTELVAKNKEEAHLGRVCARLPAAQALVRVITCNFKASAHKKGQTAEWTGSLKDGSKPLLATPQTGANS